METPQTKPDPNLARNFEVDSGISSSEKYEGGTLPSIDEALKDKFSLTLSKKACSENIEKHPESISKDLEQ